MSIPIAYDRVMETTTTTGTGTVTLAGALTGYQSFAAVGDGNTCYYCIVAVDGSGVPTGDWEVGIGTYTASGTTLARTTVKASSNSGSAVNFSAGTKRVFLTLPADWAPLPGLHLLEEHTASESASLDFTKITADYDEYHFELLDMVPHNNGQVLNILFSTDGGSTFDTGSNYGENVFRVIGSSSAIAVPGAGGISANQLRVVLPGGSDGSNISQTDGLFGHVRFFNLGSSFYKTMFSHVVLLGNADTPPQRTQIHVQAGMCYASTTAVNAVRFRYTFSGAQNIKSGTIKMYGVAK